MSILIAALLGLVGGPLVHHLAVVTGADLPMRPLVTAYRPPEDHFPVRVLVASIVNGALWAAFTWSLGTVWVLPAHLFVASLTLALFITDIDHKRIPNRLTYPGTPLAAILLGLGATIDGHAAALVRALLGAVVYTSVLFVVYLMARGGFGFGDVKLAVPLGLFLGFAGWSNLYVGALITALTGALIAVGVVVTGRGNVKAEIPYGPPMIVGAWAALIGGVHLTDLLM